MEQIQRPRMDRYDLTVHILGLPFRGLQRAAKMTAQSTVSRNKAEPTPAPEESVPAEEPAAPVQKTVLRAADRVHSHIYGTLTVCFYQYYKEGVIKAKARRDGHEKEMIFTPDIAVKSSLPFTMEGAVRFVRQQGFTDGKVASMAIPAPPLEKALNEAPKKSSKPAPAKSEEVTTVVSTPSVPTSKRPFEGSVVSFGPTKRDGRDGKPPYTTYYLKLYSNLIGEREFIGEQLAELVAENNLAEGHMVRLHPLGRRPFEVVESGKVQQRHRNEYSIERL